MKIVHLFFFFFFFFVLLQILQAPSTYAVEYQITNVDPTTPGGTRFQLEIGEPYTRQIMQTINYFIWDIFQQYLEEDRKQVETVKLVVQQYNGAEAITYGETVNVSALYLQGYQGNLKWEFTSLLHHEMTHVFQWDGEGKAPVGLVEGIADYMILKSNYYPEGFAKQGQGERWDQGYDFTARFLEYCEGLKSGFVAGLNRMMRTDYSEDFFMNLTGKSVGQLWSEYKVKYGTGTFSLAN